LTGRSDLEVPESGTEAIRRFFRLKVALSVVATAAFTERGLVDAAEALLASPA